VSAGFAPTALSLALFADAGGASDLAWLLPPAGLALGIWLGARARRSRDLQPPEGRNHDDHRHDDT
jgi:hypothetical protein